MEAAHFSLPVAIVTMAIGLSSNLIKSYSGFGGGILFVSLMKVASTAGLLGEEGHERGLGGMAGNLALVTVMETFTTCPLAIYERNNVHWPLFMALMVGSILMVPVGTSFLMGTLDDEGGDEYAMLLKKCFGVLIICFVVVQFTTDYMRSRKAAQQKARQEAAEVNPEAPDVELIERGKDAAAAVVDQVVVEVEGTDGVKEGHEEKAEVERSEEGRVERDCSRASGPGQEEAAASTTAAAAAAAAAAATPKGTSEQQGSSKNGLVVFGLDLPGIWGPWQPALLGPTAFAGAMAGFLAGLFGAGGPPVLVLFSWIGSHKDFAIPPGILRGTAISTYWVSMVIRFVAVLGQGILFLDRYWIYYLATTCAGFIGVGLGSYLHDRQPSSPVTFVRTCNAMLLVCGVFFLAPQ